MADHSTRGRPVLSLRQLLANALSSATACASSRPSRPSCWAWSSTGLDFALSLMIWGLSRSCPFFARLSTHATTISDGRFSRPRRSILTASRSPMYAEHPPMAHVITATRTIIAGTVGACVNDRGSFVGAQLDALLRAHPSADAYVSRSEPCL